MVQLVGNPLIFCRACLSREHLYVIVCCFGAMGRFRSVEALTVKGHNINVYLVSRIFPPVKALFRTPCAAAIDSGPLLRDIRTILCVNGQLSNSWAIFIVPMLLSTGVNCVIQIERNGIHIALVVHIHNGAAVTGDGLLLNGLDSKALIALGVGSRLVTGGTGHGFGFLEGILIIIGILLPVDHGVLGVLRCDPVGRQGCRPADTLHLLLAQIPAVEGKARPGRSLRQRHDLAIPGEDGGHIVAAVGIEGDPVTVLDDGVNLNGACGKIDGLICGSVRVGAPAHNSLGGVQRQVHHLSRGIPIATAHGSAIAALGGMYNGGAVLAHEQDIAEFRELCINPNGLAGNAADCAAFHCDSVLRIIQLVPALEHSAILGGVAGYAEGFPILQVLGPVLLEYSIHIEFVDVNHRLRLTDVAFGNVFHAGLAGLVDVAFRAVGGAGAHRLFRLCFNRQIIRQGFGVIQRSQAALTVRDIAILADLAILVRRILCAELRAGAGLLFRLRVLLAGCAGCAAIVRRDISVALRCRGVLAAVLRLGISVALRCRGILAALGNRGVFAAVLRRDISVALRCRGILAALGSRGVFAAVLRRDISVALRCRDISVALRCRGRRRILRAFRCRCGLFLVFRRCSGFHSGCAGCALLCLHSLGGFRAAGCGLCEDAHGAQADQHANRQQRCDPSFHVYSPLFIIRNRFL